MGKKATKCDMKKKSSKKQVEKRRIISEKSGREEIEVPEDEIRDLPRNLKTAKYDHEYEVEYITNRRRICGVNRFTSCNFDCFLQVKEYEVKWKGYPSCQKTWQTEEDLSGCRRLQRKFVFGSDCSDVSGSYSSFTDSESGSSAEESWNSSSYNSTPKSAETGDELLSGH